MRTVKLLIAFDGTDFCGWQKQKNGPTIQAEIQRALSTMCNSDIVLHGAGRTDAGVHACSMVAHFKTSSLITGENFRKGLNSILPAAIRIINAEDMPDGFHARYSALGKTYRYTLFTGQVMLPCKRHYTHHVPHDLNIDAMRSSLKYLVGEHDFSSFEATGSRDKNNENGRGAVRTIFKTELTQSGDSLVLTFIGDGFLRHMVRNLTGTIIEVGRGKLSREDFINILGYKDRSQAAATAPSCGLSLIAVHYKKAW